MRKRRLLFATLLLTIFHPFVKAQPSYFYPDQAGTMNRSIPTPEQFLGYPVGSHHTRHDKLVEYFKELDRLSDRVSVQVIGTTYEHRQQIAAIFTAAANHNRLETIRTTHLQGQTTGATENIPLVIHLGYNVHGNEPSSSEAAMLTAYYLTASESPETLKWLTDMVILMDPNINPDGRDRHTAWANMHKADPPVADPLDREHTEIWPGGRFNHYWFDLNRDWFLGVHPETRARIRFFHQWRPYVQTDHHEMGSNSTFYFDPGKSSSNNPIVPDYLYNTLYPKFGEYFAGAMNNLGSMYFTKEAFDKLYPGYGSSYINFYGGAGFLFEQASSRGHVQETTTIPITFAFTIRNQLTAALTTIRASLAEKAQLLKLRKEFYRSSAESARRSPVKGYVIGDANDRTRTRAFLNLLLLHDVEVYENSNNFSANRLRFEKGKSYVIPSEQPNYLMVRSLFEKGIPYSDSLFYDASTWSAIHAFDLPYAELRTMPAKGVRISSLPAIVSAPVARTNYAYLFDLTDYNAHKAIYHLQSGGAIVQSAFRPFTVAVNGQPKNFGYGSVSVPVSLQRISPDSLHKLVNKVSEITSIPVHSITGGYNSGGVDLGSGYLRTLQQPQVMMLVGPGVAAPEAGEIWHLLDQRLSMPVTKMDILNTGRADLSRYNTIVMVSGNYALLDKGATDKLKAWLQNGGTLVTLKTASEWAIRQGFTKEKLVPADTVKTANLRYNYDAAVEIEGAKALGGSIFAADLDTTHPIGFGVNNRLISVYKNSSTFLFPSTNPYSTVAQYTANPLIGGYLHPTSLKKVKGSAAILTGAEGAGRVIFFADNPNFRGFWYGTNKLFLNALFFGNVITIPSAVQ
jgi:hypothetical protein